MTSPGLGLVSRRTRPVCRPAFWGGGLGPELASTGLGLCPDLPTLSSRCEEGSLEEVSLTGRPGGDDHAALRARAGAERG